MYNEQQRGYSQVPARRTTDLAFNSDRSRSDPTVEKQKKLKTRFDAIPWRCVNYGTQPARSAVDGENRDVVRGGEESGMGRGRVIPNSHVNVPSDDESQPEAPLAVETTRFDDVVCSKSIRAYHAGGV